MIVTNAQGRLFFVQVWNKPKASTYSTIGVKLASEVSS